MKFFQKREPYHVCPFSSRLQGMRHPEQKKQHFNPKIILLQELSSKPLAIPSKILSPRKMMLAAGIVKLEKILKAKQSLLIPKLKILISLKNQTNFLNIFMQPLHQRIKGQNFLHAVIYSITLKILTYLQLKKMHYISLWIA